MLRITNENQRVNLSQSLWYFTGAWWILFVVWAGETFLFRVSGENRPKVLEIIDNLIKENKEWFYNLREMI